MALRRTLYRWHIWLGWIVALPLVLWTVTGLWMAARPIDEVRGEHLRRAVPPFAMTGQLTPPKGQLKALTVENRLSGPVWVASFTDGGVRRADLRTGALLPPIGRDEAMAIARTAYRGDPTITDTARTGAAHAPLDLRKARPAWSIAFADGARVYVDADTGAVLALRTTQWRLYDFMWGLHIMDPQTREDTSHALLIVLAAISVAGTLSGAVLLFTRGRKKRRAGT